jgi:hypothetical protein
MEWLNELVAAKLENASLGPFRECPFGEEIGLRSNGAGSFEAEAAVAVAVADPDSFANSSPNFELGTNPVRWGWSGCSVPGCDPAPPPPEGPKLDRASS